MQNKQALEESIKQLLLDNINLENQIAHYKYKESQDLIKTEMLDNGKLDNIIAYSIGNKDNLIYESFIINVGYKDGVVIDSLVYTRGMQPVGRVDIVNNNTSRVQLLSANGKEVDVIMANDNQKITLIGQGGGEYISKIKNSYIIDKDGNSHYSLGDKVLLGSDISMIVGEIVHIDTIKDEDMSIVHVRGYYNPASQSIFFVQPLSGDCL